MDEHFLASKAVELSADPFKTNMHIRLLICILGYNAIIATQFIYEWKWFEWSGPAIVDLQKGLSPGATKAWSFYSAATGGD